MKNTSFRSKGLLLYYTSKLVKSKALLYYIVNECTKKGNGMFTNWYFYPGRYVLQ